MTLARITGRGLAAIALAVVALWTCVVGEKLLVRRTNVEYARILRDMRTLQRQQGRRQVSMPAPRLPQPVRPTAG